MSSCRATNAKPGRPVGSAPSVEKKRNVTLTWTGRRPPLEPALAGSSAAVERYTVRDEKREAGIFLRGDNLAGLQRLLETHRGKVTLAYIDPPFLTGRAWEKRDRMTGEVTTAFDDHWDDRASYLESIGARVALIRELLAPHGSMVLHVDPKTSHYLRVLCDEIFGEDAFASEIVWRYRRWPTKTPNFQRVHDVLLRYRKDPKTPPRFHQLYEPLSTSTLKTWGDKKQRAVFGDAGKRLRSSTAEEDSRGVPMGDVWEIGVIAPVSKERTGYPSQKPELLLERIVSALTDPGELVLDAYAGSGTTLAVAATHGRPFIGLDASDVAFETVKKRLEVRGYHFATEAKPEPPVATSRADAQANKDEIARLAANSAAKERARIVAYLRREASDEEMYRDEEAYLRAADAIERGEL